MQSDWRISRTMARLRSLSLTLNAGRVSLPVRQLIERFRRNPDVGLGPLDAVSPFFDLSSGKEHRVAQLLVPRRLQVLTDIHIAPPAVRPIDPQSGRRQSLDTQETLR